MSGSETEYTDAHDPNVNTKPRQAIKKDKREVSEVKEKYRPAENLNIPPFWPEKPVIWFSQVEGQFRLKHVTDDESKFYHILSALDRQYAIEVEDILTGPPDYTRLKTELLKRLSVSKEQKHYEFLSQEQLGDRKPSQFLRHLQHLAGPEVSESFLKSIWSRRLPLALQPIVASQPSLSLDELADLADRVNAIAATPHHGVAAMTAAALPMTLPPTPSAAVPPASSIDQLTRQVAELTRQVSELTARVTHPRQSRSRERGQGYQRGRSSSRRSQSNYRRYPVCWYHYKHGSDAKRCIQPCDYKAGNAPGSQ